MDLSLCHLGEWEAEARRRGKEEGEKADFSRQPQQPGLHQRGPDTWQVASVHGNAQSSQAAMSWFQRNVCFGVTRALVRMQNRKTGTTPTSPHLAGQEFGEGFFPWLARPTPGLLFPRDPS